MHQGDEEGTYVGHLDENCEIGGQEPLLFDLRYHQGELHPHPIDGHPGAHTEEACQHVSQQCHDEGRNEAKQEM